MESDSQLGPMDSLGGPPLHGTGGAPGQEAIAKTLAPDRAQHWTEKCMREFNRRFEEEFGAKHRSDDSGPESQCRQKMPAPSNNGENNG